MTGLRSVVIHGHFYQPPRENPWTGVVDPEPNVAPDHDWNVRINRECYAPLAGIPVGSDQHDPPRFNAYNFLSYDVGPTLLSWLQQEAPGTYTALMAGDRLSRERLGYGNAMAMPYHHVILPLCSRRDKQTEVRWGLEDFRRRFGRDSVGMWLPETAVDLETLDVLAEAGIAYTVLAPHQVTEPPASGLAGRVHTGGGRSIAVFAYDGTLSHDVAFGVLLKDADAWRRTLLHLRRPLVSIATDGETYGHHHKFADLALGALLQDLAMRRGMRIENYTSVLAVHPAAVDLTLVEPSSWSCAHGVERWRADCGCRTALDGSTQQRWRAPLRQAIDWLLAEVHGVVERRGAEAPANLEFTALAAQTSCGWFFDDFAGLEGRQVLRYAARAIALCGPEAPRLEAGLLERLADAESNDPDAGTARTFYLERIKAEQPA